MKLCVCVCVFKYFHNFIYIFFGRPFHRTQHFVNMDLALLHFDLNMPFYWIPLKCTIVGLSRRVTIHDLYINTLDSINSKMHGDPKLKCRMFFNVSIEDLVWQTSEQNLPMETRFTTTSIHMEEKVIVIYPHHIILEA